jgi:hypothetical protein
VCVEGSRGVERERDVSGLTLGKDNISCALWRPCGLRGSETSADGNFGVDGGGGGWFVVICEEPSEDGGRMDQLFAWKFAARELGDGGWQGASLKSRTRQPLPGVAVSNTSNELERWRRGVGVSVGLSREGIVCHPRRH